MRKEISKTASGVTRYNVSKGRFKKLQIPIPPLSVQKEIVRFLDKFTELTKELTKELTAELTARKKQYNYYREQFFEFADVEIQREPLGIIGEFQRGKRFVKDDMLLDGVPCIHYGEMYTYYGTWASKSKSFLSEELVERKIYELLKMLMLLLLLLEKPLRTLD